MAIMNVSIVPYGNAHMSQSGGVWKFTCQHGQRECDGNQIMTCGIGLQSFDFSKYFPFIACLERSGDPTGRAQACATQTKQDWTAIQTCTKNKQGNDWQHDMGARTEAVPGRNYVPWVTINGAHSKAAESNCLSAVCNAYKGTKPPGCRGVEDPASDPSTPGRCEATERP